MNLDENLAAALTALQLSMPDRASWSGPAALIFESRLAEQIATLHSIRGGLWR